MRAKFGYIKIADASYSIILHADGKTVDLTIEQFGTEIIYRDLRMTTVCDKIRDILYLPDDYIF